MKTILSKENIKVKLPFTSDNVSTPDSADIPLSDLPESIKSKLFPNPKSEDNLMPPTLSDRVSALEEALTDILLSQMEV